MPWSEADRAKYDVIRERYSSDMSDAEFALIFPFLTPHGKISTLTVIEGLASLGCTIDDAANCLSTTQVTLNARFRRYHRVSPEMAPTTKSLWR
jgi:hypothetical protein